MRIFVGTSIPNLLVQTCSTAGDSDKFALGKDPVSELEVGSLRRAGYYYGYSEAKRFGVDGLQ